MNKIFLEVGFHLVYKILAVTLGEFLSYKDI